MPSHSDANFIDSFRRFVNLGNVISSTSWEDLQPKVTVEDMDTFFAEFKIYNFSIKIEYEILHVMTFLHDDEQVNIEEVKRYSINRMTKMRGISTPEATTTIEREVSGQDDRLLAPHVAFYIVGLGLPDLRNILNSYCGEFPEKATLVEDLTLFIKYRNRVTHNRLTSREDGLYTISEGMRIGGKILATTDRLVVHLENNREAPAMIAS